MIFGKTVNRVKPGHVEIWLWDPASRDITPKHVKPDDGAAAWGNGHENGCRGPILPAWASKWNGRTVYVFNKETGSPMRPSVDKPDELDGNSWAVLHENQVFAQMDNLDKDYRETILGVIKWIAIPTLVIGGGFVAYLIVSAVVGGS